MLLLLRQNKSNQIHLNYNLVGRGFHWEKNIDLSYWGTIELSYFKKNIMVINELPLENYLKCVATSICENVARSLAVENSPA